MCRILLSIHPEHVKKIIDGEKKYEFRKRGARISPDKIVIYATSPMKVIIGEVDVLDILQDTPENIWAQTQEKAGVSRDFFDNYFKEKQEAIAYQLGELNLFTPAKTLDEYGISFPPQSFVYLNDIC